MVAIHPGARATTHGTRLVPVCNHAMATQEATPRLGPIRVTLFETQSNGMPGVRVDCRTMPVGHTQVAVAEAEAEAEAPGGTQVALPTHHGHNEWGGFKLGLGLGLRLGLGLGPRATTRLRHCKP